MVLTTNSKCQTSHGETADPEMKLKPRHFNPHPAEAVEVAESRPIAVTVGKNVNLVDDNGLETINTATSNLFRRQSPAVFNQGPIQFPNNNIENRQLAQQPRFYLKSTNQPVFNPKDYDNDYVRNLSHFLLDNSEYFWCIIQGSTQRLLIFKQKTLCIFVCGS